MTARTTVSFSDEFGNKPVAVILAAGQAGPESVNSPKNTCKESSNSHNLLNT
jgi:hypothetical protein